MIRTFGSFEVQSSPCREIRDFVAGGLFSSVNPTVFRHSVGCLMPLTVDLLWEEGAASSKELVQCMKMAGCRPAHLGEFMALLASYPWLGKVPALACLDPFRFGIFRRRFVMWAYGTIMGRRLDVLPYGTDWRSHRNCIFAAVRFSDRCEYYDDPDPVEKK